MPEIGGAGQQRLGRARVFVVGAGGLGCVVGSYLVAAGVGTVGIIDHDTVEISNLQRQVLYNQHDIGKLKVHCAKKHLSALNSQSTVEAYGEKLSAKNAMPYIKKYDVVMDCCDNYSTRLLINDACYFAKKPLIMGAVSRFYGQLATFRAFENHLDGTPLPSYRCLVPNPPKASSSLDCSTGILGAVAGVIGTMQATEGIKEILGLGQSLAGKLLLYDGLTSQTRLLKLPYDANNPLTGKRSSIRDLSSHETPPPFTSSKPRQRKSTDTINDAKNGATKMLRPVSL